MACEVSFDAIDVAPELGGGELGEPGGALVLFKLSFPRLAKSCYNTISITKEKV